ncbi:sensor histidine kinase [Aerococcaceae bacterium WGS1372]
MTKNDYYIIVGLILILFFYLLGLGLDQVPIVELTLIIIFSAQYYLLLDWDSLDTYQPSIKLLIIYAIELSVSSVFLPYLFFFYPIFFYEVHFKFINSILTCIGLLVIGFILGQSIYSIGFVIGLCIIISYIQMHLRSNRMNEIKHFNEISYLRFRNERIESERKLMVSLQDERIKNSVLNERKRLVGEIHDLLGHQLSSSIIQIAALEYVVDDEVVKQSLKEIKRVLNDSMDNVRSVIHSERESATNLENELQNVIQSFTKAAVNFTYRNSKPLNIQMIHSIVAIVTEALTNINKHSNATTVTIRFIELADKWTLLILDNGKTPGSAVVRLNSTGIGLLNMEERVKMMNGTLFISNEKGFRIFITIPMEEEES